MADALRTPLNDTGHSITDPALEVAAVGTGGYPFLIQLVGFWMCKIADANASAVGTSLIDDVAASAGVQAARRRLGSLIHQPALQDLSQIDRTFLAAMAVDEGPSRMADLAARLNADANYVSQYRLRLIAADMVHSAGHGYVDYTLPYLRDYLREHAASTGL